ncbi:hypothetical protein V8E36_007569 [Tilletia maclaganii]
MFTLCPFVGVDLEVLVNEHQHHQARIARRQPSQVLGSPSSVRRRCSPCLCCFLLPFPVSEAMFILEHQPAMPLQGLRPPSSSSSSPARSSARMSKQSGDRGMISLLYSLSERGIRSLTLSSDLLNSLSLANHRHLPPQALGSSSLLSSLENVSAITRSSVVELDRIPAAPKPEHVNKEASYRSSTCLGRHPPAIASPLHQDTQVQASSVSRRCWSRLCPLAHSPLPRLIDHSKGGDAPLIGLIFKEAP